MNVRPASDLPPAPPQRTTVELRGELSRAEARALAQLCKRIGWQDCLQLAVDRDETQLMINATDKVRGFLDAAGVYVR